MSFRLPRAAGVLALACAASALSLPFAQPASAAAPVQKLFVVADEEPVGDLDTYSGLYTSTTPPTLDGTPVVSEDLPVHIHGLSASADGSRVIYVQDNFSPTTGDPVSQQVFVRDVGGRVVREMVKQAWDDVHFISTPVLSPDGLNAAWEVFDGNANAGDGDITLKKGSVTTGFVTTLKAHRSPYSFIDNSTLLVQDIDGNASVVTLGGATGTISNLPVEALHATVSADKQHIAFGLFTTPTGSDIDTASMQVAPLTGGGLTWTVGTPVTLSSTHFNDQPAFTPDSTKLYWTQNDGSFDAAGDIWSAPVDNSTPAAATGTTAGDENDVAVTITDDGTAPGALPSVSPAVLKGTEIDLSWTLPADGDLSGTHITRTLGGKSTVLFVPGPATSVADKGLALGSTYVYSIREVDRSGHFGPATVLTATALEAAPTTADPTSRTSATTTFPVVFGRAASESSKFTVDYVPTGGTTWTNWLTDFPDNTANFVGTAGTSYTFRVRVTDGSGNASPLVNSARAVVPFDQTKATFTGGGNVYKTGTFLGSYRKLWHSTDVARVTLVGNRLQIVGNTCGTCGFFDLFDNGTWVAGVNTYGSVTRLRQTLFTKYFTGIGSHNFTIKARGTGTRRDVMLDGFAMRT